MWKTMLTTCGKIIKKFAENSKKYLTTILLYGIIRMLKDNNTLDNKKERTL